LRDAQQWDAASGSRFVISAKALRLSAILPGSQSVRAG
jgi:hypothetical protein